LEWTDPGVSSNVKTNMPWSNRMARRESGSANDKFHMLRNDLFVADTVLHGTHGAVFVEGAGGLSNGITSVNRLGGNYAVVTSRKFVGVAGCAKLCSEIRRAGKLEAVEVDRIDVLFPDVVGPHFDLAFAREMSGEEASDCAATDDAHS